MLPWLSVTTQSHYLLIFIDCFLSNTRAFPAFPSPLTPPSPKSRFGLERALTPADNCHGWPRPRPFRSIAPPGFVAEPIFAPQST
ncbi:hypothetical protein DFH94DRAFT_769847 [Russula ochroleuca]|uniref:Uncharacterized protein n=1 Tax=Russula ochroleuca TaxID=152965 RepID=A0A9P5MME7_9AGAM|nr:hypothetical protein DFH94DRAFT_769847 [Russula ochroleuca]